MLPLAGNASATDILTAIKSNAQATNGVAQALNNFVGTLPNALLYQGQLPTSSGLLYTASASVPSIIRTVNICNTTGSTLGFYIFCVPSGGTTATSNAMFYGVTIAANSVASWDTAQVLPSGGMIYGYSSASGVTVSISGNVAL